jgi:hypothetical protein
MSGSQQRGFQFSHHKSAVVERHELIGKIACVWSQNEKQHATG